MDLALGRLSKSIELLENALVALSDFGDESLLLFTTLLHTCLVIISNHCVILLPILIIFLHVLHLHQQVSRLINKVFVLLQNISFPLECCGGGGWRPSVRVDLLGAWARLSRSRLLG